MKNILVKKVEKDDNIKGIMMEFFKDENMYSFYPLSNNEKGVYVEWYKNKIVPQGFSILSKFESDVVGIVMVTHQASIPIDKSKFESKNFKVNEEFDYFMENMLLEYLGDLNYLYILSVAVSCKFRRQNVAIQMIKKLEELAISKKFSAIILQATSEKSRNLFLKLGYSVMKEIIYADHVFESSGKKELNKIVDTVNYRSSIMMKRL